MPQPTRRMCIFTCSRGRGGSSQIPRRCSLPVTCSIWNEPLTHDVGCNCWRNWTLHGRIIQTSSRIQYMTPTFLPCVRLGRMSTAEMSLWTDCIIRIFCETTVHKPCGRHHPAPTPGPASPLPLQRISSRVHASQQAARSSPEQSLLTPAASAACNAQLTLVSRNCLLLISPYCNGS